MKTTRLAILFVALAVIGTKSFAAMSLSDMRREARFLTDRMGHELGLNNRQYEDVYEINFDFFYQVNEVIDDVVYGYDDAIDYYYYLLDVRNEDLMYVLRNRQYRKFVDRDYFFRPIYMVGNTWGMRIYSHYTDRNYYYYGIPTCYHTYTGAHYRIHFAHSYYANLYHHALYHGAFRLWGGGYHHHHYDGWHSNGKKKHMHPGSRPWSNAKNYEKSRRDLKNGFVSVPSRDENNRMVKVDSEENHRTAITSNTPVRAGSSRAESVKSNTGSRSTSAERTGSSTATRRSNTTSNVSTSTRNNSTTGTTRRANTTSTVKSENKSSGSASSLRSGNSTTVRSSSSSSSSRSTNNSSKKTSVSSSSSTSKNSVSSSNNRSSSTSKSSVSSSSSRSSSSSSSSARSSSSSSRSGGSRR